MCLPHVIGQCGFIIVVDFIPGQSIGFSGWLYRRRIVFPGNGNHISHHVYQETADVIQTFSMDWKIDGGNVMERKKKAGI